MKLFIVEVGQEYCSRDIDGLYIFDDYIKAKDFIFKTEGIQIPKGEYYGSTNYDSERLERWASITERQLNNIDKFNFTTGKWEPRGV